MDEEGKGKGRTEKNSEHLPYELNMCMYVWYVCMYVFNFLDYFTVYLQKTAYISIHPNEFLQTEGIHVTSIRSGTHDF